MNTPKSMVQALLDRGFTQTKIATTAGVTQPTISRALAGKGVSYENGKKIENFFTSVTAQSDHQNRAHPTEQQQRECESGGFCQDLVSVAP
jgi:predicted transcriptional regulator